MTETIPCVFEYPERTPKRGYVVIDQGFLCDGMGYETLYRTDEPYTRRTITGWDELDGSAIRLQVKGAAWSILVPVAFIPESVLKRTEQGMTAHEAMQIMMAV